MGETITHSTRIVEPASWWGEVELRSAGAHPKCFVDIGVNAGSVSVSHVGSSVMLEAPWANKWTSESGDCISQLGLLMR